MKTVLKYILCGLSCFLLGQRLASANNIFELEQDPNWVTYKIEKENKIVKLYFMLVKDKETNELVYCLEPGVSLSEKEYEELNEWEYAKVHLSEEQKNKISQIAYFGYGYQDHHDLNYYYAAQLLIWEQIIPNNWQIYYTNSLGGEKVAWFLKERNEILKLIEEDNKLPTFANQTFEYNQNTEFFLEDTNNVLKNFQLKEEKSDIKISNNILKINLVNPQNIHFQKEYLGNPIKFYLREDGQNIMRKGRLPKKEFQITLNPYQLKLEVEKVNEENEKIADVTFHLFAKEDIQYNNKIIYKKNELIKEIITREKQNIILNNLYTGSYCLKEISAPKEYEIQSEPICFYINKDNSYQKIIVKNKKKRQQLQIYKIDADTKVPLGNVAFQIFDEKNNCIFNGKTDKFGQITLENLIIGRYKIVEIETLDNYELKKEPIFIDLNGEDNTIEITITNQKIENVPNTKENIKIQNPILYFRKRRSI